MRATVIMNLKGGVAKTTTAVNMAALLASLHSKRVLLIDADSQCNTTEFFGGEPKNGNLADVLRHENNTVQFAINSIQLTGTRNIDLLAGDESLMDLDLTKVETNSVRTTVLRSMLRCLDEAKQYDVCLIDCPPAFNAAAAAALIAADDVIIPIKLDAFSLRGMTCLLRQISNMRKINPGLKLAGCLPTMWYKSQTIQSAESTLRGSGLPVFSPIRRTDKVDEMTFAQDPLQTFSPRSSAGIDYRQFVDEYIRGGVK
jgi:chromosome partitioning protein